jgi:hypothetical protein
VAVKSIVPINGRSSEWSWGAGRQYRAVYRVETDDANDGPQVVAAGFSLKYGDIYVNRNDRDNWAFLQSASIEEDGGAGIRSTFWIVTLTYGPFNAAEQASPDGNPLHAPPDISWGFRDMELPVLIDYQANPVLNTAGEYFDPPLTEQFSIPVLTIQRNEPLGGYSPAQAYLYRNAVNSDVFAGEQPGHSRVLQISGKRSYHPACGWYFPVTYEFEFNPDGYTHKIPSMGFRQLSISGTKLETVYIKGAPATSPVLLDKKGRYITNPATPPYILEFQTRKQLPFAVFNFDDKMLQALK